MQEIANGVFIETDYEGVNVGAIITRTGMICVDMPSYPRDARHWVSQLDRIHPGPIRYLLLTDSNGDRVINSRWLHAPIIIHQGGAEKLKSYDKRYPNAIIESLRIRNPDKGAEISNLPIAQPSISFSEELIINVGDRRIMLEHKPGCSPDNAWITLSDVDVVFTGDSLVVDTQPILAEMCSTHWIEELKVLESDEFEHMKVVPGRGELNKEADIDCLLQYLISLKKRVGKHIENGMPRENLGEHISEYRHYFLDEQLPADWIDKQIYLGLDKIYEELTTPIEDLTLDEAMGNDIQSPSASKNGKKV